MGSQVFVLAIGNDSRVNTPAALQESEYRDVPAGTTSTLPFTLPTKVSLIRLDFAAQSIARKFAGDQPAQTHEKPDRRVRLNTHEFRCCARCATCYKIFNQALLLTGRKTAPAGYIVASVTPSKILSYFNPKSLTGC